MRIRPLAGRRVAGAAAVLALAVCGAEPLRAQAASPWLPAGHWTTPLLVRLNAQGGVVGDPVARLRREGELAAELPAPFAARLAAQRTSNLAAGSLHVEAAARFTGDREVLRPGGFTADREWIPPEEVRNAAFGSLRVRAASELRAWLALTAELSIEADAFVLDHATLGAAAGGFDVWVGRRPLGFRPGEGGGLVINEVERFDGAGVRLDRPVRLPLLGTFTAETFAGPVERNGLVARPWLLGMRLHARPHSRLDAGATRGAVFGAMGPAGIGVAELVRVAVGANLSDGYADDQVASVDARWRPPLGALHAELYGEWGMHDVDIGVLLDVPAFTIGLRLPRVWGGDVGIGVEHTQISGSCCANPPWYHHFELADGWTADGALLGHPLGGQGREWRVSVTGGGLDAAILFHAGAALRTRGAENVFAPDRQGRAVLLEFAADVQRAGRFGADMRLLAEHGSTWTEVRSEVALRVRL